MNIDKRRLLIHNRDSLLFQAIFYIIHICLGAFRRKTMKISAKGRYGLSAMIYLAFHAGTSKYVTVLRISENLDISKIYLEQVFSLLKKRALSVPSRVRAAVTSFHAMLRSSPLSIYWTRLK